VKGHFYVFVDECHRTQGGDMNKQMKRWLEGAIFVGFIGHAAPAHDKKMTRDVFGTYIHTYKFHEGVADASSWTSSTRPATYPAADLAGRHRHMVRAKDQRPEQLPEGRLRKRWATMES
jgi:type I restriction enzyme R subunit